MSDKKIIIDLESQDKQRADLKKRRLMYENNWLKLLNDRLSTQFIPEIYSRLKLLTDTSQNIFRRIVREISTVYKQPAKRVLISGSKEIESPVYEEIIKESKLNVLMSEAHRLSKACTLSFLHVRTSEEKQKLLIHIYTPDEVHIEPDLEEPTEAKSISYFVKSGDKEFWVYYSKEKRLFLDTGGRELDEDPRTGEVYEKENKYGIIPIVPFHCVFPVRRFFRPDWNRDAYEANMMIGVSKTMVNHLKKCNSFKQIWGRGLSDKDVKNQILDPLFPIIMENEKAEVGTLDLTSRSMSDQMEGIKWDIAAIANNYGISADNFTISGNSQSGFALRIRNRALEEMRESDIPICESVEKELFNVIRIVYNMDFKKSISDNLELKFNPGEVDFPETWQDEQAQWQFEFDNGISNSIDYLISRDPQLSREEAKQKLLDMKKESIEIKPSKSLLDNILNPQKSTQTQTGLNIQNQNPIISQGGANGQPTQG